MNETKNLAEIIGYQKDSVVSKTIAQKASGTITLFAFDEGQGLSQHTAPFDAFVYMLEGDAKITIAGKPLFAKQGDLVIMPAGKPHSLAAEKKFKMLLVMMKS